MYQLMKPIRQNICKRIRGFQSSADPSPKHHPKLSDALDSLKKIISDDNISTSATVREQNGKDEGPFRSYPPDAVVWPQTTQEVSEVAKVCQRFSIPMIPFGTGTGLESGVGALIGGVCVNLSKMTKVLQVDQDDFDATVEPGVTRTALNEYIRDTGLWFPIDPGAEASLGGMAATSASGTNAVRYGTMRENVLNLEVVLADGTIIHTAGLKGRARKSSAGYNLTNLFVGSEGTLGLITKATLRLHAIPETMVAAVCPFPSVKAAIETTIQVLQSCIPVARIEFMDEAAMECCNAYNKLNYRVAPTLFLEFHGSKSEVEAQAQIMETISKENGASDFQWAEDLETRNKLWKARHSIFYAVLASKPGHRAVLTDVCVPISKLTDVILYAKSTMASSNVSGPILGHVGDGNFHSFLLFDPHKDGALEKAKFIAKLMGEKAMELDGTCTGEHGVGMGKMDLLKTEFGENGLRVMSQIKKALDPKNIMNPGKIIHVQ